MNSFTAKPYGPASKHSSLPRTGPQGNDQAQPGTKSMPSLSGDILKQRIASMQKQKPGKPGKPGDGAFSTPKSFVSSGTPVISESEIQLRRNSMHRTPPPPTPDTKPNYDKSVPEFLRKKLKPIGIPENEQSKQESESIKEEDKAQVDEISKKSFRNSKLMFENISVASNVGPKPKPKPKSFKSINGLTKNGNGDQGHILKQDESTVDPGTENKGEEESKTQTDFEKSIKNGGQQSEGEDTAVVVEESCPESNTDAESGNGAEEKIKGEIENVQDDCQNSEIAANLKPLDVKLPTVPIGLSAWMDRYVKKNPKLQKPESNKNEAALSIPGKEFGGFSQAGIGAASDVNAIEDELYDDVNNDLKDTSKDDADLVYDDVQSGQQQVDAAISNDGEEFYDDIVVGGSSAAIDASNDEVYDDVAGTASDEVYDDVAGKEPSSNEPEPEIYDDVNTEAAPVYEIEEGEIGEQEQPGFYEPVESIQQYMRQDQVGKDAVDAAASPANDKASKKREEKERKEREKLEKKKKEEAERKFKKEEEERKKREREERKRIEKERKSFDLKPDEDPVPIERHMATASMKGKGKDLAITRGEYLDVISKNKCPKGKVLVQNCYGKLGFVWLKDLGIDKRKSLIEASSPVAAV
eukprot:gene4911-21246_t